MLPATQPNQFANGAAPYLRADDESDDEVLASNLVEALNDDDDEDLDSLGLTQTQSRGNDLQERLQLAAQPLEFQATLDARFASYDNYCSLFHFILNSDGPVEMETGRNELVGGSWSGGGSRLCPVFRGGEGYQNAGLIVIQHYWAWDVIDEFIYQFNTFCIHRNRVARKSQPEDEVQILRENPQSWGCYSVLNVLYSLIQRSQMNEQLAAIKRGEDPNEVAGEYGARPLYRMLGYFSIIGLLRVHCLLGDFTLALKTLEDIELNKKAVFAKVMAAHFTTYYYVGFSYMMLRRYGDAIKAFTHILIYVSRTKNFHKNSQFDTVCFQVRDG